MWSKFSADEIERRRRLSVDAFEDIRRREFSDWYQLRCDSKYWQFGQRCSGCDYWASDQGDSGECQHGGIIPGADVMRSMGCTFSSYTPPPGYPYTEGDHWCANFKDEFDWLSLGKDYLEKIGAINGGILRDKPKHRDPHKINAKRG